MQRTRKKKYLILVSVFAGVFVALIVYAIFNVDAMAQRYKPVIETVVSEALGSEVSIGTIGATVFPTARITMTQLRIAVPDVQEEAMSLDGATLHVRLLPLLQGSIDATSLTLNVPKLTFLKDEDGIRLSGLPKERPAPDGEEAVEGEMVTLSVEIEQIEIRSGRIVLRDTVSGDRQVIDPVNLQAGIALENTGIRLSDLQGDARVLEAIDVAFGGGGVEYQFEKGITSLNRVEAQLDGGTLLLDGGLRPGDPAQQLKITSGGVDLAGLDALWEAFAPALKDYKLRGTVAPDLVVALTESGYTATGTLGISETAADIAGVKVTELAAALGVDANEARQTLTTSNATLALNGILAGIAAKALLEGEDATLSDVKITAFNGELSGGANAKLGGTTTYGTNASASGLSIEELAAALFPSVPLKLTGTVQSVSVEVNGALDEAPLVTLGGDGALELADGILKDINLAKQVMAAVEGIPFLSGTLLDIAPPAIKAQLDRDYTVLDKVTGTLQLADGKMNSSDLHVDGNLFTLDAQGWLGFDTTLDLRTQFALNPELSAALAQSVNELERLFDADGRLAFPVHLTGTASELRVRPDLEKLLRDTVRSQVQREAGKLLEGLSGGDDAESGGAEEKSPLGGLLNQLRR